MDSYSCKLSSSEIKKLQRLLKTYKKEARGNSVVHFYKYQNTTITIYKNNRVHFQGQNIINTVNEILSQVRNEHSLNVTLNKDKINKNKTVSADHFNRFEKALEIIETPQKKYSVHTTKLEDLCRILAFRFIYLRSKDNLNWNEFSIITTTKKEQELIRNEIADIFTNFDASLDYYFLTLHAFCLRLINNNHNVLGYKNKFKWMSNVAKESLVQDICKKIGVFENEELYKNITKITSLQKTHDLTIEEALKIVLQNDCAAFKDKIVAFNDEYKHRCLESGELDFDDMLVLARNGLKQHPDIELEFPKRILFDASGRMNKIEQEIVNLLAQKSTDFYIVWLDDKNEIIEKSLTPVNFLGSTNDLSLSANWFSSNKNDEFRNPLLKSFLYQRYSADYLKNLHTNHWTENKRSSNFHLFNYKTSINSWTKSKALSKKELIEIGCDEVGTGDYFGGIVTAAVALQPGQLDKLPLNLIADSKLLTKEQIVDFYKQLKDSISFSVTVLTPSEYNQLYDDYQNANIIKAYAHNKTLINLIEKEKINLEKSYIVMDQFAQQSYYKQYLDKIRPKRKVEINLFNIHAETKYVSVALASILARYYFLEQIKQLQKKANVPIYLGASNSRIKTSAMEIYNKYDIKQFVKYHFSFTKDLKNSDSAKKD